MKIKHASVEFKKNDTIYRVNIILDCCIFPAMLDKIAFECAPVMDGALIQSIYFYEEEVK